jgi:hypothetical protein
MLHSLKASDLNNETIFGIEMSKTQDLTILPSTGSKQL